MALLCSCPPASALSLITLPACFEQFGQIQKLWFQRVYSSGTTKNKFTIASANPNLIASWAPLLTASNGTKVVQSPFIENPQGPTAGEPRTNGGGNARLGGIDSVTGLNSSTFVGTYYNLPQNVAGEIEPLMCETALGVYLINEYGQIGGIADDNGTPTEFYPIPIAKQTFYIMDKSFGNLEEDDANQIGFQLLPRWSRQFYVVNPSDFNPLDAQATS